MNEIAPAQKSPLVQFKHDLDRLQDAKELALPETVSFRAFKNAAVVAVTDNPGILNSNKQSLFKAIRTLAAAGLVPDGREAAIVSFKGQAQAMPMVAGLVKVARNSGKIASLWADVVYEGETLEVWVEDGERRWNHVKTDGSNIDAMERGGKIRGAYAVAKLTDGSIEFQPMSFDEIEKRRRASPNQRAKDPTGIWEGWYDEMARKTVIRNLCKRLPMSSEDIDRIMKEQDAPTFRDVTPEPERAPLAQRLQQAAEEPKDEPIDGEVTEADPFSEEYNLGLAAAKEGEEREPPQAFDETQVMNWLAGYDFHATKETDE